MLAHRSGRKRLHKVGRKPSEVQFAATSPHLIENTRPSPVENPKPNRIRSPIEANLRPNEPGWEMPGVIETAAHSMHWRARAGASWGWFAPGVQTGTSSRARRPSGLRRWSLALFEDYAAGVSTGNFQTLLAPRRQIHYRHPPEKFSRGE
jgi:hypothetical protein